MSQTNEPKEQDGGAGKSSPLCDRFASHLGVDIDALSELRLVRTGRVREVQSWARWQLEWPDREIESLVNNYLVSLLAYSEPATLYFYGHDLLRWLRFLESMSVRVLDAKARHAQASLIYLTHSQKPGGLQANPIAAIPKAWVVAAHFDRGVREVSVVPVSS